MPPGTLSLRTGFGRLPFAYAPFFEFWNDCPCPQWATIPIFRWPNAPWTFMGWSFYYRFNIKLQYCRCASLYLQI